MKKNLPSPLTILLFVVILAALATWLIPAGKYNTLSYDQDQKSFVLQKINESVSLPLNQSTLDSLGIKIPLNNFTSGQIRKPVSVPGSYVQIERNSQSFLDIIQAPLKGVIDSIDVVLFILVIGGFIHLFNESGALVSGLTALSIRMKGKESWLIIILTFLFSFAGASYGMAEEGLVFYAVMVPLFLRAGYDLLVPVAVIFGGTQLGTLSSFTNPFSTIIASNAAGINWTDGLLQRLILFTITTAVTIIYIVRYAQKVKRNPEASIVFQTDGCLPQPEVTTSTENNTGSIGRKNTILLLVFLATFLTMIGGVIWLHWWLLEMSTLFLAASILVAFIQRISEKQFIQTFIQGAESMLAVALIVGTARGVSIVLNDGHIADTIIYNATQATQGLPPVLFIISLLLVFIVFTLFIASSSGMAVLTMPIMGSMATLMDIPGREIVNAYLYGMGIMGFLTPTGLILPSLALVNVSIKAWIKFITPLLLLLVVICILSLIIGIYL
ncbi:MAG TPA: hypothetical protein PKY29_02990 [Ferruginibacter sp.]|nr:hypothetical protein [Ferruginibacter sp.]HRO17497.1 hypothetical protein [Ferruginibacter sp.]HRQ20250.1 hypothetical protein [Ferruginibacter sp.]